MKLVRDVMKVWRLAAELTISLKAVRVFGELVSSLNDHPPIDIHVFREAFLVFKFVKREYKVAELASIGEIWKVVGSKKANAKLMCVNAVKSISSGSRVSHTRVEALYYVNYK